MSLKSKAISIRPKNSKRKPHKTKKQAEDLVAQAQVKAADIVARARREAEEERAHIVSDAQAHAAGLMEKSRDAIANERHKATVELSGFVVDLSVEIASKIIGSGMTIEDQRKLAERCLEEVGAQHDEDQA